jgi:hypothetical protein
VADDRRPIESRVSTVSGAVGEAVFGVPLAGAICWLTFSGRTFAILAVVLVAGAVVWPALLAPLLTYRVDADGVIHEIRRRSSAQFRVKEITSISYDWVPYSDACLDIRTPDGVIIVPLNDESQDFRFEVGRQFRELYPGRMFADQRAMRALGINLH